MTRVRISTLTPPVNGKPKPSGGYLSGFEPLSRDHWTHVALTWWRNPKRGGALDWHVYVDGYYGRDSHQKGIRGGPEAIQWPAGFSKIEIACGQLFNRHTTMDAVVDGLRISRVNRYKVTQHEQTFFTPRQMELDKDTIVLFRFDGDTVGTGPNGDAYTAQFTNRDE